MKIGFLSLGCPKNLVDSEVMLGLVQQAGHQIVADAATAEVLVVNTCAFIDSAKQESVDAVLEMAALKRSGACRRLVVTGCLAERYRDDLRREIPDIDAVLGTGEVPEIVGAVDPGARAAAPVALFRRSDFPDARTARPRSGIRPSARSGRPEPVEGRDPESGIRQLPTYLYDAATPRVQTTPRHYAYVKVAEGCDYTCAFCIIPQLRGPYRSRPVDSVVEEARALAAQGVRELILISQDTTFYGIDRGERGALARLLRRLDAVDDLTWIRLLYLYPTTITDATLDAMADCQRVCKYIDLPLQHAASGVLARMRRPGTRRQYETLLRRIRDRLPGVSLRTTFIVGFPGETAADFEELVDFVRSVEFDHVGVFTYSHEDDTRAYGLGDTVPAEVKVRRRDRLMREQRAVVRHRLRPRIGEAAPILVDGPSAESPLVWQGRLEGQAPEIDSVVYLTECDPSMLAAGQLIRAEIVDTREYDLVARPLSRPEASLTASAEATAVRRSFQRRRKAGSTGVKAGSTTGAVELPRKLECPPLGGQWLACNGPESRLR